MINHSSKRKRTARDEDMDNSRKGTTLVRRDAPTSAPSKATYSWMIRQATPGPSGTERGNTPAYDLRRNTPTIGDQPSLRSQSGAASVPIASGVPEWVERVETRAGHHPTPTHLHPSATVHPASANLGPQPNLAAWSWTGDEPPRHFSAGTPWQNVQQNAYAYAGNVASQYTPHLPEHTTGAWIATREERVGRQAQARRGGEAWAETQGGWQVLPAQTSGGNDNRPDSRVSYVPMQVDVDIPRTPLQRQDDPFHPASAFPYPFRRASDLPRRATPFPRTASARPYQPRRMQVEEPTPRRPSNPILLHATDAPPYTQVYRNAQTPPPLAAPATPHPRLWGTERLATQGQTTHAPTTFPPNQTTGTIFAQPPPHPTDQEQPMPDLMAIAEEEEEGDLFVTPMPAGGWPDIHGGRPDWQYENMANAMFKLWKARTFPHCLVAMAGEGACDPGEARRRTVQEDAISRVFGIKVEIVQAQAADQKRKRNDAPLCNMVQIIYPADLQRVLDAKCISIRDGPTLFFFPAKPALPTFMLNFERPEAFGTRKRNPTRIVRERMTRNAIRTRFIQIFRREMEIHGDNDQTAEERADAMIEVTTIKLVTRVYRGEEIPLATVYCAVPTDEEDTWYAIRDAFRTAKLGTDISGHPTPYTKPMKCGICHGVDHDTSMCKFPRAPEWSGPKNDSRSDDDIDEDNTTSAHGRNGKGKRGFKSRGRGGSVSFAPRGGRR